MRWRRRSHESIGLRGVALLVVLAILATVGIVVGWRHFDGEVDQAREVASTVPPPTQSPEPDPTVVLVMGDSYTSGSPMNQGSPTWAPILANQRGWILGNDSIGASGYLNARYDDELFAPRAEKDVNRWAADLVLLAGGLNDWLNSDREITAAVRKVIDEFHTLPGTDVVLLSPFGGPAPRREILDERDLFRKIAAREHIPFIDVTDIFTGKNADLIGKDGLHPIPAGHELLAEKIGAQLDALGLPRPDAYTGAS